MSSSIPALAALLKQTHIEDHEEVLKSADSALKQSKGDVEIQHIKAVALLKLDRFEDAIRTFETGGDKLKSNAQLEYAYALYKSGKSAEAAEIARQGRERGYKHVEAQATYRTEDFKRAADLYQQLASQLENDAVVDLRINTGAVDAQLEWAGQGEHVRKKKPKREDMEAFETAYNAACLVIARGELAQGEVLLKRAKDLCNSVEELSEEEKEAELLPITVQQVYVLTRQGKVKEAEQLAQSINAKNISDASTRHIALVNTIVASAKSTNPYLTQRLVTKNLDTLKPDYPFTFQSIILRQNRLASDLQALKLGGSADSTAAFISNQPSPTLDAYTNTISVINAAAHAKVQTGKEALKHILPVLEKRPNDVALILILVQLYVLTGNSGSAITLLESFLNRLEQNGSVADLDVRFAPGLVGAMISLYHNDGRRGHIRTEFAKAVTHWRRKPKERPSGVLHLLKAAGSAMLESQVNDHQQLAQHIFTELHEQDEGDQYAAAGLLAASPQTAATSQQSILTPIDRLVAEIDIDSLEIAGIAQPPTSTNAAVTARKRPAETLKPRKTKKLRKSRMPKDYDPDKTLDPERWLPLRERSTYRPKGKKGKARQNLLSQGAAPAADSDGSRPGTPGAEVVKAKQQQQGAGGGKKKKAKGGKR